MPDFGKERPPAGTGGGASLGKNAVLCFRGSPYSMPSIMPASPRQIMAAVLILGSLNSFLEAA